MQTTRRQECLRHKGLSGLGGISQKLSRIYWVVIQRTGQPHQHWHLDVSYLNVCATFYYLCSILDGYSRFLVHCICGNR